MSVVIQFPQAERRLTSEEQRIIDLTEKRNGGRKLTQQQINLSLEQARALGEL
jgi:hypothetical protein